MRCLSLLAAVVCIIGLFSSASSHAEVAPKNAIVEALQPFVDSGTLAGAVLAVASKEKILSLDAVGFEDIAGKQPMRPDSLFWIASMSKPMTATALMMLVDDGKLDPDDLVEKYLPEFKELMLETGSGKELKKPSRPIAIKDILSHTSGMGFMSGIEQGKVDGYSLREAVLSYAKMPLKTEPGTKYAYSNAGINTVGRIIEVVSGMPYETFMDERLLKPLGMKDTTFWPNEEQLKRIAKSYKPNKEKNGLEEIPVNQLHYPLTARTRGPSPAGGYFSTGADMAAFGRMLLNGGELDGKRYISEASLKRMTSKQTGNLDAGYGYGFSADKQPGRPFGHGGAYSTDLRIDPQRQIVLVYLVQHAGYANADGGKIQPAFHKAAETFGKQPAPALK